MILHRIVGALLFAGVFQSTVIFAHFQLDIDVRSLLDTVGNCGGGFDICALYIDHFCLRPPDYRPIRDDEDDNCPLALSEADLETSNLPQQRSLTSTQPWPINFQLFMEISDDDAFNSDDDIDNVFILASQEVSSEFSGVSQVISATTRIIMQMRFRVTCTDGYVGPRCDCHSQNDDTNGHYQCEDDGTITCLPGYEDPSTFCRQEIDACSSSPCQNGGTCMLADPYLCLCRPGFSGPDCSIDINECLLDSPCLNGASCEDLPGGYLCICPPDYTGINCGAAIDHCVDVRCPQNSTCVDSVGTHICVCNPGYVGPDCTSVLPEQMCSCENGSSCIERDGAYSCVCPVGFTGDNCSAPLSSDQNEKESVGMPAAAIAGVVAGILLALVCVALVVVLLCLQWKKAAYFRGLLAKLPVKTLSRNSSTNKDPCLSTNSSRENNLISGRIASNPMYGEVQSPGPGGDSGTLRLLSNPLYKVKVEGDGIYSIPSSIPSKQAVELGGEAVGSGRAVGASPYSYATVGTGQGGGVAVEEHEYAVTGPGSGTVTAPYNRLDHGLGSPETPVRLAELDVGYEPMTQIM